jgi:H+/Cl- antiporter ClcA
MQEIAIVYGITAWLLCWWIDLAVIVFRGPVMPDPLLKLIIVTVALMAILVTLQRHHWLW